MSDDGIPIDDLTVKVYRMTADRAIVSLWKLIGYMCNEARTEALVTDVRLLIELQRHPSVQALLEKRKDGDG